MFHCKYSACSCFFGFYNPLLVVGLAEWVFSGGLMLDEVCLMLAFVPRLLATSGVGSCDVGG